MQVKWNADKSSVTSVKLRKKKSLRITKGLPRILHTQRDVDVVARTKSARLSGCLARCLFYLQGGRGLGLELSFEGITA